MNCEVESSEQRVVYSVSQDHFILRTSLASCFQTTLGNERAGQRGCGDLCRELHAGKLC